LLGQLKLQSLVARAAGYGNLDMPSKKYFINGIGGGFRLFKMRIKRVKKTENVTVKVTNSVAG
jgi:hypothetical protein